ncbi:hypothetical protein V1511DRAFT_494915 [Dipodascopsis uninucleata]
MGGEIRRSRRNISRKNYSLLEEDIEDDGAGSPDVEADIDENEYRDQKLINSGESSVTTGQSSKRSENSAERKIDIRSMGLSAEEYSEISDVFELGCEESGLFPSDNLEDALLALGFDISRQELREIIQTGDPSGSGYIDNALFIEIMSYKYQERKREVSSVAERAKEFEHAFNLFVNNRADKHFITLEDLRRAANVAKDESVTDEELREMIGIASGNSYGSVGYDDFVKIYTLL